MDQLEAWCLNNHWPSPRGLSYGLAMVLVVQVGLLFYYIFMRWRKWPHVQKDPPPFTTLGTDLWDHISAPESFFLVYGYLIFVWMLRLMPDSYYDLEASFYLPNLLLQFLVADFWIYVAHRIEHYFPSYYVPSHKPHHRFLNPKLYNAFNGSVMDTITLILVPLFLTHQCCRSVHCWDFIAFGSLYAAQLSLIHCEFPQPWDHLFQKLGIATTADHHVHHSKFIWNYGHFFVYWDVLCGTYKSPSEVDVIKWGK